MQDNDARLAALQDLTSIPLGDLIDAYNTSDGNMSEKRRMVRLLHICSSVCCSVCCRRCRSLLIIAADCCVPIVLANCLTGPSWVFMLYIQTGDIVCCIIVGSGLEEFDTSKRRYQQQHLGVLRSRQCYT